MVNDRLKSIYKSVVDECLCKLASSTNNARHRSVADGPKRLSSEEMMKCIVLLLLLQWTPLFTVHTQGRDSIKTTQHIPPHSHAFLQYKTQHSNLTMNAALHEDVPCKLNDTAQSIWELINKSANYWGSEVDARVLLCSPLGLCLLLVLRLHLHRDVRRCGARCSHGNNGCLLSY